MGSIERNAARIRIFAAVAIATAATACGRSASAQNVEPTTTPNFPRYQCQAPDKISNPNQPNSQISVDWSALPSNENTVTIEGTKLTFTDDNKVKVSQSGATLATLNNPERTPLEIKLPRQTIITFQCDQEHRWYTTVSRN